MQEIRSYAIVALAFISLSASSYLMFRKDSNPYLRIIILVGLVFSYTFLIYFFSAYWGFVFGASLLVGGLCALFEAKQEEEESDSSIILKHSKGQLKFFNAFVGWLIYGGAGSGKTVSIGKPLLAEFMRNKFSFFIYDAKDNDYTKTAFWLKKELEYPYPIYNIDIVNLSNSYRFNPIKTSLIADEMEVEELATNLYKVLAKKSVLSEWDDKAKGVLIACAYYIYYYHPDKFTYPHILNLPLQLEADELIELFEKNPTCRTYAGALFDAKGSKPTESSIRSTLSGVISSFAANKRIGYVLTGDDFDFYLNDPENPKSFTITNTLKYRNQISPFVALLFVNVVKRIEFGNTVPMVGFLDEATTFKIEDLEAYPSELREYLFAMVLLTQDPAKIEKMYGKNDLSSLESNLQNHFYGRSKSLESGKKFSGMFAQIQEKKKSYTVGGKAQRKSTTISSLDKEKYKPEFFNRLKPGQFVGSAAEGNVNEFDVRFKPYSGSKLETNPFVRKVTDKDIEKNYQSIISDVKNIYKITQNKKPKTVKNEKEKTLVTK